MNVFIIIIQKLKIFAIKIIIFTNIEADLIILKSILKLNLMKIF